MNLSATNSVPLYRQIAADIWEQIQSGELKPGDQLPSETALCATYSVNRLTVRQAVVELQRLGALEIRRGRGTFIASPPDLVEIVMSEPFRRQRRDSTNDALALGIDRRTDEGTANALPTPPLRVVEERVVSVVDDARGYWSDIAAGHLAVPVGSLLRLDTVMVRQGRPWVVNTYWFPEAFAGVCTHLGEGHTVVYALNQDMGLDLVYRWRAFSAAAANYEEGRLLEVQVGTALLVRDGVTTTSEGNPVFYVRRRLRGDTAKFVVRYGDDSDLL